MLLELIPPLAFSLLGLFVVAWPSVCYVMFIKDLKEQCCFFFSTSEKKKKKKNQWNQAAANPTGH